MNKLQHTATRMLLMAMALQGIAAVAGEIPVQLPKPDGKPGEATKPVKVYLLAGQSNMNGMGDLTGARPPWPSVLLAADPAIIPGSMPIGGSALAAHGVYQSADPKAEKGALVSLYKGAYDAKVDYAKLKPAKQATVAMGTLAILKTPSASKLIWVLELPLLCGVAFAPIHSGNRLADRHKGTVFANSAQKILPEQVGENSDSVTPPACRGGVIRRDRASKRSRLSWAAPRSSVWARCGPARGGFWRGGSMRSIPSESGAGGPH